MTLIRGTHTRGIVYRRKEILRCAQDDTAEAAWFDSQNVFFEMYCPQGFPLRPTPPLREPGSFVFLPLFQITGLGCPGDECFDVDGVEVGDASGTQVVELGSWFGVELARVRPTAGARAKP